MRRLLLVAVTLLSIAGPPTSRWALSQQAPNDEISDDEPLEFRPHLVLTSELGDQVQGMRALNRTEFYRMLSEINARGTSASTVTGIVKSVYWATLEQDQLVAGHAWLEFAHSGNAPTSFVLDPSRLPLNQMQWIDTEMPPVIAGSDARRRSVIVVDRSATLACSWSLRGRYDPLGTLQFSTSLPKSPVNHLVLNLPDGYLPEVEKGIVTEITNEPLEQYLPEVNFLSDAATESTRRNWLIELGGIPTLTLRVTPGDQREDHNGTLLQETLNYQLTEAGIELRAGLSIDVLHSSVRKLLISADPPLQIASARLGDEQLTVRRTEDPQEVVLEFSEPLNASGREITVIAMAPLVMDSLWQFPSIRVKNTTWQQGTATLHIPGTLILKRLDPLGYVETNVEPLPIPQAGEIRRFRAHAPDARLNVVIGTPPSRIRVDAGTTVRVAEQRVTSRTVADVRSLQGQRFVVEATRARAWNIDSVETLPADAFDGYELSGRRRSRLQIRLRQPVAPENPVRIVIQASRRALTPGGYSAIDLCPIDFRNTLDQQHILSVYPESSSHLTVSNDPQVKRLSQDELTVDQLERIDVTAAAVVYENGPHTDLLRIEPRRNKPGYSARISIEAIADPNRLEQTFRIRCEPESTQVAQVLVHFSRASDEPLTWNLEGGANGALDARKLSRQESVDAGETWAVTLRQPSAERFELRATRTVPFAAELPLALASAPEANSQTGTLRIGSVGEDRVHIAAPLLKAIPAEHPQADLYPRVRAHYRYDPSSDLTVTLSRAAPRELPPAAWIWSYRLVSRFEQNGRAEHEALLLLENTGQQYTTIEIPSSANLQSVSVDRVEVALPTTPSDTGLNIKLPNNRRFPVIRLRFQTEAAELGVTSVMQAPLARVDLPCLERSWSVWLPPGYRAINDPRSLPRARHNLPRWDERLFGMRLLRTSGRPFDPLSADQWASLIRSPIDGGTSSRSAASFLGRLAQLEMSDASLTWGEVVARYAASRRRNPDGGSLPNLRIDSEVLARWGVTPSSPRPTTGAPYATQELLAAENLALVVDRDTVLLTTIGELARLRSQTIPTRNRNLVLAGASHSLSDLFLAERWLETSTASQWVENGSHRRDFQDDPELVSTIGAGWSNYEFQIADAGTAELRIHSTRLASVLEWALLIITLGLELCLFQTSLRRFFIFGCVSAAVVLVAPTELVFLARPLFLGSLIAFCTALLQRPARESSSLVHSGSYLRWWQPMVGTAGVAVWIAVLWDGSNLLPAAEIEIAAETKRTRVFRIIVPMDADRQPAGNYVYLPENLYDTLHHRSSFAQEANQGWLIETASYSLELARQFDADEVRVRKLVAVYDITTSQETARVRLPWRLTDLIDATIDGMRASPTSQGDGEQVEFLVPTGRSRLEVSLRPLLRDEPEQRNLSLRIPRIARSTLKITTPANMEDIDVPSALGAITAQSGPDEMHRSVVANLGPTDRLTVQFQHDRVPQDELPDADVAQLVWFNVQANSVTVDAQFTFAVRSGSLSHVRLIVNPRLQLQPFREDQPVASYKDASADSPAIAIDLDQAYSRGSKVTLRAKFVYGNAPPLGQLQIPQLSADVRRPSQSWIAVSAADNLDVRLSTLEPDQEIAPSEFLSAWQDNGEEPRLAFRLRTEKNSAALLIQRRPAETNISTDAEYTLSRDRLSLDYRARFETSAGYSFQQRVSVPGDLILRSVTATQTDEDLELRWSTDGSGQVTVFFDAPITGNYEIQLTGEMPITRGKPFPLPLLTWNKATTEIESLTLNRSPDIRLVINEVAGLTRQSGGNESPSSKLPRIAASFQRSVADIRPASVSVEVHANRPRPSTNLEIALSYVDQEWFVEAELELQVGGGVLDFVRLSMPGELSAPLEIEPDAPYEFDLIPGSTNRVLTLHRPAEISRPWKVRFRCRLTSLPDVPIQAPDLYVLDATESTRILILPSKVGEQQLAWETAGLHEIPVPQGYAERLPPSVSVTAYHQFGDTMRAAVRNVARVSGDPRVYLADHYVCCRQDGTCYGVVAFDVEPARQRECLLHVPAGLQLVHLSIAGFPAAAKAAGDERWRFRLGPDGMSQRIEVIFTGTLANAQGHVRLQGPSLVDLPPSRTLWTVRAPPSAARVSASLDRAQSEELNHFRLDDLEALLELSSDVAARSPPKEFDIWRNVWLLRRDRVTASLVSRGVSRSSPSGQDEVPVARSANQPIRSSVREHSDTWHRTSSIQGPVAHFQQLGALPDLELQFESFRLSDFIVRWLLAAACVMVAGLGHVALSLNSVCEWTVRWPHIFGVCLGLAYWLWFWPSFLGCVLSMLFVLSAIRLPWHSKRG